MYTIDLQGKHALVMGVANKESAAWAIVEALAGAGARIALNYQTERLATRVQDLAATLDNPLVAPCDVTHPEEVDSLFSLVEREFGKVDILVHSLAFASRDEFAKEFVDTSREGFLQAIEISALSLISLSRAALPLMQKAGSGSIMALTYLGGERVVAGYKLMGPAKATLDANVRYLAENLGPHNVRVNAISAGAMRTLSLAGIPGGRNFLLDLPERTPLRRNITQAEVGDTALYLASSLSSGVTGETIHVDAGYHIIGL